MRLGVVGLASLLWAACGAEPEEPAEASPADEEVIEPLDGEDESFVDAEGKADVGGSAGISNYSWESSCVLEFVNRGTYGLYKDARLWDVAAAGIMNKRYGGGATGGSGWREKVEAGQPPVFEFETLEQLDAVPWVGDIALYRLLTYAEENDFCPAHNAEFVPPGEDEAIAQIEEIVLGVIERDADVERSPVAVRQQHAKHHGCLQATLEVDPDGLPGSARVGLFAEADSYPAWIRFSNGKGSIESDHDADARGMAIKVMSVPGDKLLEDEIGTQDFVLLNSPAMFVRDNFEYIELSQANADGNPLAYFLNLRDLRIPELLTVLNILRRKPASPLTTRYWSTTPYLLGPEPSNTAPSPATPTMRTPRSPRRPARTSCAR